jgi:hypothetical protein
MNKIKRGLSGALAALVLAVSAFTAAPVRAEGTDQAQLPKVNLLYGDHSPIMVGEKQNFYVTADFEGQVQYKLWLKDVKGEWHETEYTEAVDAKIPTKIAADWTYAGGYNAAVVWVKTADTEGAFQKENKLSGGMVGYDNYQVRKFYTESERPVVVGDSEIVKEVNGLTVTVNGIEGMDENNEYRVTAYDYQTNQWIGIDNEFAAAPVEYTFPAAGYYLLDVQTRRAGQENWEALKLEVINLEEAPAVEELPEAEVVMAEYKSDIYQTYVQVALPTEAEGRYEVTVNGEKAEEFKAEEGKVYFDCFLNSKVAKEDVEVEVVDTQAGETPVVDEDMPASEVVMAEYKSDIYQTYVQVTVETEEASKYNVLVNGEAAESFKSENGKTYFDCFLNSKVTQDQVEVKVELAE